MNYFRFSPILSLLFFTSCFGDKHPEYPYLSNMVDSVIFFYTQTDTLQNPTSNADYASLVINGKSLFGKKDNFYDLQGNWIKNTCLDSLFAEQELEMTGKQTDTGYCILHKRNNGRLDTGGFYLFDFENEKLVGEIPILDIETWLQPEITKSVFNSTLVYKLTVSNLQLPTVPKRLFAADYDSHKAFKNAEEERDKKLRADYQKAVMDLVAKHKNEVYTYEFYNEIYHRNTPCFVFAKEGLAIKIEGDMNMDGLPSYADYLHPEVDSTNSPITFEQTGKASLGYKFRLIASLVPWLEEEVVYNYELVCGEKKFNFKSATPDIYLSDCKETTDCIYFALTSSSHKANLYRFRR